MGSHHFPHRLLWSNFDLKLARPIGETELRTYVQRQSHVAGGGGGGGGM